MTIFNGGFRVAPRRNAVCTLAEGSVAAPTASQRRSRVAASQRRSANSVAASLQRRSVAAPTTSQRRSVAAPPAPRSVAASQRRSATRPRERHSATSETHASAPFAPALIISHVSYHHSHENCIYLPLSAIIGLHGFQPLDIIII